MDKRDLVRHLLEGLTREIAVLEHAANSTREAATHEENRPENDKDTRAIEAGYLAGAQAERVRALQLSANALEFLPLRAFGPSDPVALSALVDVELDGKRHLYFIAPRGGGLVAELEGTRVTVVTPEAPLGRALLGKTEGEEATVPAPGGHREYEIVRVR